VWATSCPLSVTCKRLALPLTLNLLLLLSLSPAAGPVLAAAGVDFDAELFNLLGPDYVARLMRKTGVLSQWGWLVASHALHSF